MGEFFDKILSWHIGSLKLSDIFIILICLIVALIADKVTQYIFSKIQKRHAKKPESHRAEVVRIMFDSLVRPLHWFFITVGCALGFVFIDVPEGWTTFIGIITTLLRACSLWCVFWFALRLTASFTTYFIEKAKATETKLDDMIVPIAGSTLKFLIVCIGILVIIETLGVDVTPAIASLGIGVGALALASKDTLANFFGALVVFFDRPFEIGDWVTINNVEGEIEEIRLRVTLIRTFDNTVVYIPNSVLSSANINNWQMRKWRKMDCSFGVLYSTTAEQIETIVSNLREHVKTHPETYGPSYYIHLDSFGDSSINIRVVVYSIDKGYVQHLQDKQDFMLVVMRIVEQAGTSFAFPTRTIEFSKGKVLPEIMPE
ncbi:MAG: mechanosensitive ion channel family protein [Proteobacteria bacterium]|jgi:MscS family membrane protein|nr:mechanosensitive ion channel family protein [Pseudomonadota bacterium]